MITRALDLSRIRGALLVFERLLGGSDCQGFQNPQGSGVGSVGVRVGVGISNP